MKVVVEARDSTRAAVAILEEEDLAMLEEFANYYARATSHFDDEDFQRRATKATRFIEWLRMENNHGMA